MVTPTRPRQQRPMAMIENEKFYCLYDQYALPASIEQCSHETASAFVGYKKIVISSKPTASSFSFGQKHKHIARNDTDGPGPANYDITGLSVRGIEIILRVVKCT